MHVVQTPRGGGRAQLLLTRLIIIQVMPRLPSLLHPRNGLDDPMDLPLSRF